MDKVFVTLRNFNPCFSFPNRKTFPKPGDPPCLPVF